MKVLDTIPFTIEAAEVIRQAHLAEAGEEIAAQVRKLVDTAQQVGRPKAVYEICYVENKQECAVDVGGVTFTSRVLRANLDAVERIFVYVATCGTELHQISTPSGDILLGYCLDLIKDQALAAAMHHLNQYLKRKYALGKTAGMNPGSLEDWPITEQRNLFAIFRDVEQLIGVKLTESCLMIPNKSLSGITFPAEVTFASCQLCPREVCVNRSTLFDAKLAREYGILE
jgi:hypothetical protein